MKRKNFVRASIDQAGVVWRHNANGTRTRLKGKTNWKRLKSRTPEERHAAALADPDCQPTKPEDWADAWRPADLPALRRKLRMSQAAFATTYGLNVRTVQDWEQGRKMPDGPARVLVALIARAPKKVASLLHKD